MRDLFSLRLLAVLALLIVALWSNDNLIAHHHADSPFDKLYGHLMPADLVGSHDGGQDGHADHSDGADSLEEAEHGPDGHGADGHGEGEHGADEHGADGHGDEEHGDGDHGAAAAHSDDHGSGEALVSIPLPGFLAGTFGGGNDALEMTNLQIFQIASILLIFVCLGGVAGHLRHGNGDVVSRLFAGFALWLRNEVLYPVMGKEESHRWLPYFMSVFFFILFMNLMGLVPWSSTPTASIFVTAALAFTTLFIMLAFGIKAQGPVGYFKNLVPHVPVFIWPLMFVVELMGMLIKPAALMIRLFATMMGGHLVVLTFTGLILFLAKFGPGIAYGVAPVAVGFAVFIMIIEGFVALLQAYIFTQLSVIFVQGAIHPDH